MSSAHSCCCFPTICSQGEGRIQAWPMLHPVQSLLTRAQRSHCCTLHGESKRVKFLRGVPAYCSHIENTNRPCTTACGSTYPLVAPPERRQNTQPKVAHGMPNARPSLLSSLEYDLARSVGEPPIVNFHY